MADLNIQDLTRLLGAAGPLFGGGGTEVTQSSSIANSLTTALSINNAFGGSTGKSEASAPVNQSPVSSAAPVPVDQPILGSSLLSNPSAALEQLHGNFSTNTMIWIAGGAFAIVAAFAFSRKRGK